MNPARILALLVIALAAVVVPVSVSSADLLVRGYVGTGNDNPLYDRFANSSDFIGAGLNFSGVGQDASGGVNADQNRWATMISPHFFVSAGHWPPSGTVTFYDDNSKTISHSYSILGGEQIYDSGTATDVYVGILGSAITSSEVYYPLLDPTYVEQGQSILVYGEPNRLGTNVFTADDVLTFDLQRKNADGSLTTISTQKGYQFYYPENGNPGDACLQPYDSGGPSFVRIGNQLVLVGTHSGEGATADGYVSADTSPSFYIDEINAAMADLATQYSVGGGESVTVVPEPSSVILLGVAAVGIVAYSRRRHRAIV